MSQMDAEKLADLVPKIMSAFHDMNRHSESGESMTMRQFQALVVLRVNESMSVSDLCEKLQLAPSTGTELVHRMIQTGFIVKTSEVSDRRQVNIQLSEKGAEVFMRRWQGMVNMFAGLLTRFSAEDRQAFVQAFETIYSLLHDIQTDQGHPGHEQPKAT